MKRGRLERGFAVAMVVAGLLCNVGLLRSGVALGTLLIGLGMVLGTDP